MILIRGLILSLGLALGGAGVAQDMGFDGIGLGVGGAFPIIPIYPGDAPASPIEPGEWFQPYFPGGSIPPLDALGKCDAGICGPGTEGGGTLPCVNITCSRSEPRIVPVDLSPWSASTGASFRSKINLAPVVALLTPGFQVLCTGTAIGPNAVLTAAHCACDPQAAVVYFGDKVPDPGGSAQDPLHPGFAFPVKRSIDDDSTSFIAEFCAAEDDRRHDLVDLGILRFDNDASASAFIAHPSVQIGTALSWTIAGFGVNDFIGADATPEQQRLGGLKLTNSAITVSTCLGPPGENCLPGAEWVSRPWPGTTNDTCNGDSGGPLFADAAFIGVTRGRLSRTGTAFCGHGGVYTRFDGTTLNERGETPLDWVVRVLGETDWKD